MLVENLLKRPLHLLLKFSKLVKKMPDIILASKSKVRKDILKKQY